VSNPKLPSLGGDSKIPPGAEQKGPKIFAPGYGEITYFTRGSAKVGMEEIGGSLKIV
jgi:hypothetical protein